MAATVSGSSAFVETCRTVAKAHGFSVVGDDGQPLNPPVKATHLSAGAANSGATTPHVVPQRNVERPRPYALASPNFRPPTEAVARPDSEADLLEAQMAVYRDRTERGR